MSIQSKLEYTRLNKWKHDDYGDGDDDEDSDERVTEWPRVNLVGATLTSRPVTSSPLKQVKDCEQCRERFVQAHRLDPGTDSDVSFDAMIRAKLRI